MVVRTHIVKTETLLSVIFKLLYCGTWEHILIIGNGGRKFCFEYSLFTYKVNL